MSQLIFLIDENKLISCQKFRLIDNEESVNYAGEFGWKAYYTLEQIYAWLDEKLLQYPNVLTNYTVGTSYEGRTIRAVKFSKKSVSQKENSEKPVSSENHFKFPQGNPTVFIESNIHAREWITSASATFLLNELLNSTEPAIVDLAENVDWVIVPVLNVDGFAYTHDRVNKINSTESHKHFDNKSFFLESHVAQDTSTTFVKYLRRCRSEPKL